MPFVVPEDITVLLNEIHDYVKTLPVSMQRQIGLDLYGKYAEWKLTIEQLSLLKDDSSGEEGNPYPQTF